MQLVLAYLAGLLTLANPCVLPVVPIVLASAVQASPRGPLALCAGLGLSFVALGMVFAVAGRGLGIDADQLARAGGLVMAAFGLVMLVPAAERRFALATAGVAGQADRRMTRLQATGATGQFLGGLLLGAVWSPCIGPTLGGAVALAAQGRDLTLAAATMTAFAAGVATVMLLLAHGARAALMRRRDALRAAAGWARPVMGAVFTAVGLMIFFRLTHAIEGWLLTLMPPWLQDLSVSV